MTNSGHPQIGISLDAKPHAYDPAANPELFEGVLTRRVVAFVIDLIIIAIPLVAGVDVHLRVRMVTFGPRLGAVLAVVAGFGDLGAVLLRPDAGQRRIRHHRHARHGNGNAHLVRRAGLFRARRRACRRFLGQRQRPDAVHPPGRPVQRPPAAAARHAGGHGGHQQPGPRGGLVARARRGADRRFRL